VIVATAEERGVTNLCRVLVLISRTQCQTYRLGSFYKRTAGFRRITFNVMRQSQNRRQVNTCHYVAVIQRDPGTVAPGEVGGKAVVLTELGIVVNGCTNAAITGS